MTQHCIEGDPAARSACWEGFRRGNSMALAFRSPHPDPSPQARAGIASTRRFRSWWGYALIGLFLSATQPAVAVQPDEILKDSGLEARARALSRELRCMVCQNQSIDDSDAPLARDLRVLVRERLTSGDSDSQVVDFLVARYGEFVLLKPRFAWHNAVLWLTPAAALLAGGIAMFVAMRRRRKVPLAATPLSPDEERRLAEVIDPAS
jgi:cytochrome c-type biogenesis protein CcmH